MPDNDMTVPIALDGATTQHPACCIAETADRAPGDPQPLLAASRTDRSLPWTLVGECDGPCWSYVRGNRGTIEVAACTRAGDARRHANQDAAVVVPLPGGMVIVGVMDGITGSQGIDSGQLRNKLVDDFRVLLGTGLTAPVDLVHRLHREARRWLDRIAPHAATGAAIAVVSIDIDSGRMDWANAGDIRILRYTPRTKVWHKVVNRSPEKVLNELARTVGSNRLQSAAGQSHPLKVEAGSHRLAEADIVVLTTDGATAPLPQTTRCLASFARSDQIAGLETLVTRLDRLAIECSNAFDDDRSVVALRMAR